MTDLHAVENAARGEPGKPKDATFIPLNQVPERYKNRVELTQKNKFIQAA